MRLVILVHPGVIGPPLAALQDSGEAVHEKKALRIVDMELGNPGAVFAAGLPGFI